MDSNYILRRLRYTFDLDDSTMITIFRFGGHKTTRKEISDWLKKDDDPDFKQCSSEKLAFFLNGFITNRRGKKDGTKREPEKVLSNNNIFMKLKIALNLKSEDILGIMETADFRISKHELSAFFRRKGHKHYQECKDQILRYFLKGLQLQYRPEK